MLSIIGLTSYEQSRTVSSFRCKASETSFRLRSPDFLDYSIVKFKGLHSSIEREFYNLIRGGFLKYIMQMKIGRMQGAAIAYHNT